MMSFSGSVPESSPKPFLMLVLLAVLSTAWPSLAGRSETETGTSAAAKFQGAFDLMTHDQGAGLSEYVEMRAVYGGMHGMEKRQAAQMLSMADAMYGRYQDAEDHYYDAFPDAEKPAACPAAGVLAKPALDMVEDVPKEARVVLINESHSFVATRALIYRLLPKLRAKGFRYLALEALAPSDDDGASAATGGADSSVAANDAALTARGYPLDRSAFGFYLREPLYAEVVRRALSLGFTLVAYESRQAFPREAREQAQADALARLLALEPQAKVAVIAGYSHIWKADGWMADRLQKKTSARMVSIDQVSGLWGCADGAAGTRRAGLNPYVLVMQDGATWTAMPEKTDVTVIQPPRKDGRSAPSGWLTLAGERRGIAPATAACADRWPCLVSAYYASESREAVPADRVLLDDGDDESRLFLRPGQYRYVVESGGGVHENDLTVP